MDRPHWRAWVSYLPHGILEIEGGLIALFGDGPALHPVKCVSNLMGSYGSEVRTDRRQIKEVEQTT